MDTVEMEEKLERFRRFLADVIMCREDRMLNARDPKTADIYEGQYNLSRNIEREFIRTFSTELTVKTDEQT
jgi:hypothetical protein